ncbi:hypothetical protein GCM10027342_09020 [Photobacterium alginatilyticum]
MRDNLQHPVICQGGVSTAQTEAQNKQTDAEHYGEQVKRFDGQIHNELTGENGSDRLIS